MKNTIHWIGVVATVVLGAVLAFFHILPVEHEIIFIGALFWLWQGLSWLCNFYEDPRHSRRLQHIWGWVQLGLGILWLPLSMVAGPAVSVWLAVITCPAIVLYFIVERRYRT